MKLTENDWLFINDLIFKINSIPDLDKMRYTFLELLRILIPCSSLSFFLADENSNMKSPIQIGISDEWMQRYLDELGTIDYKRWIFVSGQNRTYRQTDLFPDGEREKQPYYQKVYIPCNIHYEAILSLAYNKTFVGVVSVFRPKDGTDFSDRDIYILEILKDHLAYRLYRDLFEESNVSGKDKTEKFMARLKTEYNLTNREMEILGLIAKGEQNDSICAKLYISISTLRKHTVSIYRKLGIKNRVELFKLLTP